MLDKIGIKWYLLQVSFQCGLVYGVLNHLQQYFSYLLAVNFVG